MRKSQNDPKQMMTLRDIANEMGEPFHRVRYAVKEGGIKEVTRIGIVRIFSPEQLPAIRDALIRMSRRTLTGSSAEAGIASPDPAVGE